MFDNSAFIFTFYIFNNTFFNTLINTLKILINTFFNNDIKIKNKQANYAKGKKNIFSIRFFPLICDSAPNLFPSLFRQKKSPLRKIYGPLNRKPFTSIFFHNAQIQA